MWGYLLVRQAIPNNHIQIKSEILRGGLMRKFLHKYIIRFIAWYIRDMCGGASHVYPYGEQGRYIVIMNEDKYNKFTWL